MPPLTGVLETALYVADLERASAFYQRLLGARVLLAEADRMRALDVAGRQVLLLFRMGASCGRMHVCFAIPADALAAWEAHLATLGVHAALDRDAERGATCLYLRDPDGHLVELATPGLWEIY